MKTIGNGRVLALYVPLLLVFAAVAYGVTGPTVDSANDVAPTYYSFQGRTINLQLDTEELIVQYDPGTGADRRAEILAELHLDALDDEAFGTVSRRAVKLRSPMAGPGDVAARVKALAGIPEVNFVSPVFRDSRGGRIIMTPQILVRFQPQFNNSAKRALARLLRNAAIIEESFGGLAGAFKLQTTARDGFEVLAEANRLARDPQVAWAEPNMYTEIWLDYLPDDPGFDSLWGIRNTGQYGDSTDYDLDGDLAWDSTTGCPEIKVMIMDTGIDPDHPDLNQWPGSDFTGQGGEGGPLTTLSNHGTAVAGCVSAIIDNELGTVGIAPDCHVLSARMFISLGGMGLVLHSWVVDALAWGVASGARVSSSSWGGGSPSSALDDQFAATRDSGMVHFASTGNCSGGGYWTIYPASYSSVNSVNATSFDGDLAYFSCWSDSLAFCAPGEHIFTTDRVGEDGYTDSNYVFVNGTSFSAPYAAGVAALLLSWDPGLTPQAVEDTLKATCRDLGEPGWDSLFGWGLLNAYDAICAVTPADHDGDGIIACDNCPHDYNPSQEDADGDNVGDACDKWVNDPSNDEDRDGVGVPSDNCPLVYNPGQEDEDLDGVGDVCDNCVYTANNSQTDADDDGMGDACDGCPDDTYEFLLNGEGTYDYFGRALDGAGDVDGDHYDDIIVGAPSNDDEGTNAGKAYVFGGGDLSDTLYVLFGEAAGDNFGFAVAGAGDVNDDGFADFMIGAPSSDSGATDCGRVYVYSGQTGNRLMTISGVAVSQQMGGYVAAAGDMNNDGFDDIAACYRGGVCVFYGDTLASPVYLSADDADMGFGVLYYAACGAGDVNNDGYDDLLISGFYTQYQEHAYIFSGQTGDTLYVLNGENAGDGFSRTIAAAGDVDDDGYADVVIGAPYYPDIYLGRAYVYSGQTGEVIHTLAGKIPYTFYGYDVASAGDLDKDGHDDPMIFGISSSTVGGFPGWVDVYSGADGHLLYTTSDPDAYTYATIANAGDVDANGYDDLLLHGYVSYEDNEGSVMVYLIGGDCDEDGLWDMCDSQAGYCDCTGYCDGNGDGIIDEDDVDYLIDYIYDDTAPPVDLFCCPGINGDWDCDGNLNILDVVRIINFLFKGGAAPCEPCDCEDYPSDCPNWP